MTGSCKIVTRSESACPLQVMAVPMSRQSSAVSMHELRLPSSSSVTAYRSETFPLAASVWEYAHPVAERPCF